MSDCTYRRSPGPCKAPRHHKRIAELEAVLFVANGQAYEAIHRAEKAEAELAKERKENECWAIDYQGLQYELKERVKPDLEDTRIRAEKAEAEVERLNAFVQYLRDLEHRFGPAAEWKIGFLLRDIERSQGA